MFADVIISSPLVSAGFLLVHAIDRTSENINFAPGSSLARQSPNAEAMTSIARGSELKTGMLLRGQ